ncbi:MAG: DUF4124 domain-containing protein [Pseudomonadota bacterium]
MKLFSIICIVVLLGALCAPFFITVNGKPMLTLDRVIDDATPEALDTPTVVYRWQDEQGRWQFGEQPPPSVAAEQISVDDRITRMDDGWHVKPLTEAETKPALDLQAPGIAGYVQGGQQLMDKAAAEVEKLNERAEQMEAMRRNLN